VPAPSPSRPGRPERKRQSRIPRATGRPNGLLYNEVMFFFIGGVQPRTKVLGEESRVCPVCGRAAVRRQRTDHYLSLFFIPLFPVRKGVPYYACGHCGAVFDESGGPPVGEGRPPARGRRVCRFCGRGLEGDFAYCPYCGRPAE